MHAHRACAGVASTGPSRVEAKTRATHSRVIEPFRGTVQNACSRLRAARGEVGRPRA
jgi:hypothetical protein